MKTEIEGREEAPKKEEYMKGHPDSVSPIEILQDRLKMIDNYIYRLEKSGNTGTDFLEFYKCKSIEFQRAIKKLL